MVSPPLNVGALHDNVPEFPVESVTAREPTADGVADGIALICAPGTEVMAWPAEVIACTKKLYRVPF